MSEGVDLLKDCVTSVGSGRGEGWSGMSGNVRVFFSGNKRSGNVVSTSSASLIKSMRLVM